MTYDKSQIEIRLKGLGIKIGSVRFLPIILNKEVTKLIKSNFQRQQWRILGNEWKFDLVNDKTKAKAEIW